jgi:enterochelin esterase family protein
MKVYAILVAALLSIPASAFAQAAVDTSRVQKVNFLKPLFGRERNVWVAVPKAGAQGANLLVAFDGPDFMNAIPLPAILDSMTAAGEIPPTVAVLIDNGTGPTRIEDLGNRTMFANWVCDQLIPWMRSRYQLTNDPHRTTALGSSAGGLAAAFIALRRPEVVGNAVSLSGAFWRNGEAKASPPWEWLTDLVASGPKKDARIVLDVGERETVRTLGGQGPSILDANRRFRDALKRRGYAYTYREAPGGYHAPESWAQRLPGALDSLRTIAGN